MWIVTHALTPGYLLQLRKDKEGKRWGIFRWENMSHTRTQDNFTCPANKACPFLIMTFYGCQFHVLPIVFGNEYWLPHFAGNYLDFNNHNHLLTDCEKTIQGLLCGQTSHIWEPCLLENSINYCESTIFPQSYSMFFDVAPQFVCIVTDDINTTSNYQLGNPFSGCLAHTDHLY